MMRTKILILLMLSISKYILSQSYFYSFENTFSGWDTVGIDLQLGDTTIAWFIHPSDDNAVDSSYSLQYYLENYNDQGKIWIQKSFSVEQQKDYVVNLDYKFASRDFGMANLWTIISGVHLLPPDSAHELIFQGHTGNGFNFDTGYVWLDKNYEFNINSETSNSLWIVIGIWGTWETPRIYFIDSLLIRIREEDPNALPDDVAFTPGYFLQQNYPNPFNPITNIEYRISNTEFVSLKVYDVLGNEIATLVNEEKTACSHTIEFNAAGLGSGVYIYKLQSGELVSSRKMLLLK